LFARSISFQVLLITSFIAYFNQTALETTLTPFTNQQFNWNEMEVSILFAVAGVEITLVYVVLHYLTKKFLDQSILLFGYILLSFACIIAVSVLPFSEPSSQKYLPIFLIFVALDILALPLIVVTSTSLFTQHINNDEQGIGQGIQRFVISIATVIGPLYAGSLLQLTWIMLCVMTLIVLFATFLILVIYRSLRSKPDEESSALIRPVTHDR
jgi:MFS transporter, ceroid-lipofuscinosis neuronal protein 7